MQTLQREILKIIDVHTVPGNEISEPQIVSTLKWLAIQDGLDLQVDGRQVREVIRELRKSREIIASNGKGYGRPANLSEAKKYIKKQFTDRAKDELHTAKCQYQAAVNFFGRQMKFREER